MHTAVASARRRRHIPHCTHTLSLHTAHTLRVCIDRSRRARLLPHLRRRDMPDGESSARPASSTCTASKGSKGEMECACDGYTERRYHIQSVQRICDGGTAATPTSVQLDACRVNLCLQTACAPVDAHSASSRNQTKVSMMLPEQRGVSRGNNTNESRDSSVCNGGRPHNDVEHAATLPP